jgi:hypothetical protein
MVFGYVIFIVSAGLGIWMALITDQVCGSVIDGVETLTYHFIS